MAAICWLAREIAPRGRSTRCRSKCSSSTAPGNSVGYEVVDARGREWKAKLGEEVQPEIVASRLLWAIGFHQPPMYHVPNLQLEGGRGEDSGQQARVRAEFGYKTESDWSWHENPFVGTRQMKGLLVANLILNNWDLKATQNRIYVIEGARRRPDAPLRRPGSRRGAWQDRLADRQPQRRRRVRAAEPDQAGRPTASSNSITTPGTPSSSRTSRRPTSCGRAGSSPA